MARRSRSLVLTVSRPSWSIRGAAAAVAVMRCSRVLRGGRGLRRGGFLGPKVEPRDVFAQPAGRKLAVVRLDGIKDAVVLAPQFAQDVRPGFHRVHGALDVADDGPAEGLHHGGDNGVPGERAQRDME